MRHNHTHATMVLDESGSMAKIRGDVVGGVNGFIDAQRGAPGQFTFSLITFASTVRRTGVHINPYTFPYLNGLNYAPRGWTALYDAIAYAIEETGRALAEMPDEERPGKVIIAIMTDGEENYSAIHKHWSTIAPMIAHQHEVYKWEFVFLGANQDVMANSRRLNIPQAAAYEYEATASSVRAASAALNDGVMRYRAGQEAHVKMSPSPGQVPDPPPAPEIVRRERKSDG